MHNALKAFIRRGFPLEKNTKQSNFCESVPLHLLERFGGDLLGFKRAAESLGGKTKDLADLAHKISAFPKVPLFYLFWEGDEEFEPRLSVLFDRSVEKHLSADAIWGLVNLTTEDLLRAPLSPL